MNTAQKMMEHWILGKWNEWWMQPFIGLNAFSSLVLFFCVPALIIVFLWSCHTGNPAPVSFVLKVMFWSGIAGVSIVAVGYLLGCWIDLVRERRKEKGKTITFQEIVGEKLDFERWCD